MKMKGLLFIVLTIYTITAATAQLPEQKLTKEEYIELYKDAAIEQMNHFSIPACITLAQGILESGSGNSLLATEANNHFGIKCHKEWTGPTYHMDDDSENECFRKYENALESYKDHSLFLTTRPRYAFLFDLDINDYKAWAHGLKTAGYATNPNYANLLIKNIEEFELYKFDKNYVSKPKPVDKSISEKEPKGKKHIGEEEYFDEITLGEYSRKVFKNNGVSFIYAKKEDTFQSISGDLDIPVWQLKSYNDLSKKDEVTEGQAIYLQAKKTRGKTAFHIVVPGETLYDISQQHAVKLKKLCKYNTLDRDAKLFPDQKIKLR